MSWCLPFAFPRHPALNVSLNGADMEEGRKMILSCNGRKSESVKNRKERKTILLSHCVPLRSFVVWNISWLWDFYVNPRFSVDLKLPGKELAASALLFFSGKCSETCLEFTIFCRIHAMIASFAVKNSRNCGKHDINQQSTFPWSSQHARTSCSRNNSISRIDSGESILFLFGTSIPRTYMESKFNFHQVELRTFIASQSNAGIRKLASGTENLWSNRSKSHDEWQFLFASSSRSWCEVCLPAVFLEKGYFVLRNAIASSWNYVGMPFRALVWCFWRGMFLIKYLLRNAIKLERFSRKFLHEPEQEDFPLSFEVSELLITFCHRKFVGSFTKLPAKKFTLN